MSKNIIIYPFLLALVPIIGLFEHNQDIASPAYLPAPLLVALLTSIFLFLFINFFIQNYSKSGIIISVLAISFFFFHKLSLLFENIGHNSVNPAWPAIIIYAVVIVIFSYHILKSQKNFHNLNKILNVFAISIIAIQLSSISIYQYQHHNKNNNPHINFANNQDIVKDLPDIYYIILDGYGRHDVLKDIYNYDNSEFIENLTIRGFYVADKAHSNYNQTFFSVTSALNMKYLNYLSQSDNDIKDRSVLRDMLRDNIIYDYLKTKNYTFVSLPSTWSGTHNNYKTDIHLASDKKQNDFNLMLLQKTPIYPFFPGVRMNYYPQYVWGILDKIPQVADIEAPTFSYIHLLAAHPPFVFDAHGNIRDVKVSCRIPTDGSHYFEICPGVEKYKKEYSEQVSYMNKEIIKFVDKIIEKSDIAPIIILQGDHGPGAHLDWDSMANSNVNERLSILNAYYLPEHIKEKLYPNISPINSFRIIFNGLFNDNFDILEDNSYFATWDEPYKFTLVNDQLK